MSGVTIRAMADGDLASCLAIEEQSSPVPWTAGIMTDELHGEGRQYLVACLDSGQVVGFCGMLCQVGEGHVTNVAVDPRWRGQRIAARLLFASVRWALTQQVSSLTLEVRVGN